MARSDYYIPIFDSLPGHKKERAIREAMGWSGFESVGFLVWFLLQVAADFPHGELPGLDGLKATLRRVWKAANIKNVRKDRLQLIENALLDKDTGWVEWVGDQVLVIHDWEDGAGMFAAKREQEREKKRRQRGQERLARLGNSVPGTGAQCPRGDGGEKEKEERENIPPNPPQAGGEFHEFQSLVSRMWTEACAKVPVAVAQDNSTTRGIASIAKQLQAGGVTEESVGRAMENFLRLKHNSPDSASMAKWGLPALAKSISAYIPKSDSAGAPRSYRMVSMRCGTCGYECTVRVPKTGEPPAIPCADRFISGERKCDGMMAFVAEIA